MRRQGAGGGRGRAFVLLFEVGWMWRPCINMLRLLMAEVYPSLGLPFQGSLVGVRGGRTMGEMKYLDIRYMASNSLPCPENLPLLERIANSATKEHQQRLQTDDPTYRQPFPPIGGRILEGNIRNEEQRIQKRRFSNKLKPHDRFKQNQLLLEETFTSKNYKK